MQKLNHKQALFHAVVEKDVTLIQYGTLSYTVFVDENGNPNMDTLKISKNKRIKYVNK